jgi:hypothetical protein
MEAPNQDPQSNPLRDSWKPSEKAAEAAIDNPAEFQNGATSSEDGEGPTLGGLLREPEQPNCPAKPKPSPSTPAHRLQR